MTTWKSPYERELEPQHEALLHFFRVQLRLTDEETTKLDELLYDFGKACVEHWMAEAERSARGW